MKQDGKYLSAFEMRKIQQDHHNRQVQEMFDKIYSSIHSHAMNVSKPARVNIDCKDNIVGQAAVKKIEDLGYKVSRDENEDRTIIVSWEDV